MQQSSSWKILPDADFVDLQVSITVGYPSLGHPIPGPFCHCVRYARCYAGNAALTRCMQQHVRNYSLAYNGEVLRSVGEIGNRPRRWL